MQEQLLQQKGLKPFKAYREFDFTIKAAIYKKGGYLSNHNEQAHN